MKKSNYSHGFATMLVALVILAIGAGEVFGQNFENNTGGTYSAGTNGVIKMKSPAGQFTSTVGANALGRDAATRIQGTVDWTGAVAQDVQGRWYTKLLLSNAGAKTVQDAVYVFDTYSASGGSRTYQGTFYYDGDGSLGAGSQLIFAEFGASAGTDRYNNLNLLGGQTKNVVAADQVYVDGSLTSIAGTDLDVNGNMIIGRGAAPAASNVAGVLNVDGASSGFTVENTAATFAGNVNMKNGGATNGKFVMDGTGTVDFQGTTTVETTGGSVNVNAGAGLLTVSGSLTLQNAADAKLDLAAATEMDVTGSYVNSYTNLTNSTYNATSIVKYNGAGNQTIQATVTTNPYGDLRTVNSGKTAGGDVFMAGDLSVSGGDIDMYVGAPQNYVLTLQDVTKTATYAAAEEVVGRMRYAGDLAIGTPYTFNNTNTIVNFSAEGITAADYFEISSRPQIAPEMYDATRDVNRKITLAYTGTWTASIQAGYKATDVPGTWTAGYTENMIRDYEAKSPDIEKITTGSAYTRDQTGAIHFVTLAGIQNTANAITVAPNPDNTFLTGNDLVLRSGPTTFITIADGRWTNPATWDEGAVPTFVDNAEIRHLVYTGIEGAAFGTTGWPDDEVDGAGLGDAGAAINNITIILADATYTHPSLVIGNDDGTIGATRLFRTRTTGLLTGLFNNNATANAGNGDDKNMLPGATPVHGLWVMTANGLKIPTFGASQITNAGTVQNNGTIEIGQ